MTKIIYIYMYKKISKHLVKSWIWRLFYEILKYNWHLFFVFHTSYVCSLTVLTHYDNTWLAFCFSDVLYELVQNAGGNISYKLLAVKGINQVKFNVKTCDVASITLKKTTAPYESLSIIVSLLAAHENVIMIVKHSFENKSDFIWQNQ